MNLINNYASKDLTCLSDWSRHDLPELPFEVSQTQLLVEIRNLAVELAKVVLGVRVHLKDVGDGHFLRVLVHKQLVLKDKHKHFHTIKSTQPIFTNSKLRTSDINTSQTSLFEILTSRRFSYSFRVGKFLAFVSTPSTMNSWKSFSSE